MRKHLDFQNIIVYVSTETELNCSECICFTCEIKCIGLKINLTKLKQNLMD